MTTTVPVLPVPRDGITGGPALRDQLDSLRHTLAGGDLSTVQAACELTIMLVDLLTSRGTPVRTVAVVAYPWRQLRCERGWSQREMFRRLSRLAAERGTRLPDWPTFKRNLCRWENGTVAVSPFYRDLLARLFEVGAR